MQLLQRNGQGDELVQVLAEFDPRRVALDDRDLIRNFFVLVAVLKYHLTAHIYRVFKGFQTSIAYQVRCASDAEIRLQERLALVQAHISLKRAVRNDAFTVLFEQRTPNFVLKMVDLIAKSDNIYTVSPQPSKP